MRRFVVLALLTACARSEPKSAIPPSAPESAIARRGSRPLPASVSLVRDDLRVTHGEILAPSSGSVEGARLRIEDAVVRAVVRAKTLQDVELDFTYRGPTPSRFTLGSGASRVQIGAKLRAADSCNVVYSMLRLEPRTTLIVQVKHNPNAHVHGDCGTSGYRTVTPDVVIPIAAIAIGSRHRLRARIAPERGRELGVWLDGVLVWKGDLGPEALTFDGPVGLRSDNGRFDLALIVKETSDSE